MPQMNLTKQCKFCKQLKQISVDVDGFRRWLRGDLIQVALPNSSADDRELLQSGTCGPCYDKLFAEVEDAR